MVCDRDVMVHQGLHGLGQGLNGLGQGLNGLGQGLNGLTGSSWSDRVFMV